MIDLLSMNELIIHHNFMQTPTCVSGRSDEDIDTTLNYFQSKLREMDQAKEAYNNAIVFKPDYVMAFHHLSVIKTFAKGDPQIKRLEKLIINPDLTDFDRCRLFFVSAKVQEDLGLLDKSLRDLKTGGGLRKNLLK